MLLFLGFYLYFSSVYVFFLFLKSFYEVAHFFLVLDGVEAFSVIVDFCFCY